MGAQSFIMMFQAGEGWQYGKRRISAMSNEDFNKLTPERLLQNQAATLRSSLGTIEKSMNDMTPMIETIIHQYGEFLKVVIRETPSVLLGVTGGKTPQEIMSQLPPETSSSSRSAIAKALENINPFTILDPLPSTLAAGSTTSTSSGAIITHVVDKPGSKIHGPQGPTIPKYQFRGYESPQARAIREASAATFKESFSQQVGSTGMSIEKRNLTRALVSLQEKLAIAIAAVTHDIQQMASQHSSVRTAGRRNIDRDRRNVSSYERLIVLQKVKINRLRF